MFLCEPKKDQGENCWQVKCFYLNKKGKEASLKAECKYFLMKTL